MIPISILPDFIKAKSQFSSAVKNSKNPFYKTKYADLGECVNAVSQALEDNNFTLMQEVHCCDNGIALETLLIHSSGEIIRSGVLRMPCGKEEPQSYGATLTYARRYSLMTLCGIIPEDDDANCTVNNYNKNEKNSKSKFDSLKENSKIDHSLVDIAKMYANKGTEELKKWFLSLEENKKVSLTPLKADLWNKAKAVDESKNQEK